MFKNFLTAIIIFPVFAQAQNKPDTSPKPFITPISKPFGNIASAKIDSRGGKLKSDDGELEVIIPENTLDTATLISIQSTPNDLNENDQGAYQLEPSGKTFKNPVHLVFHFKDENSDMKSIGWQDGEGKWHIAKNIIVDSIQKTVSCFASHFSQWAQFDRMYISPSRATVKVNKTKTLEIKTYKTSKEKESEDDLDLMYGPNDNNENNDNDLLAAPKVFYIKEWTVNGIVNGDYDVGTVTRSTFNLPAGVSGTNLTEATYKAPAVVPSNNPVAVSVQVYSNQKNKKLLLTSNINIIGDQYHLTYIHIDENGCYFLVDSSSCIINMQKENVSISNIINYKPWSDWPQCDKACRDEWTNKETIKGGVEITGIASSTITPASNGALPNVNIVFLPAMGNTPSEIIHCKDGDRPIPSMPRPADPRMINFDIDGDDVVIHYAGKTSRNELVLERKNEKTMIYVYKVN